MVKVKNGKKVVDWNDKVSRESIVLCGFEFTASLRLKRKTVKELKELYSHYFSKALYTIAFRLFYDNYIRASLHTVSEFLHLIFSV